MSADTVVQALENTLAMDRYGYVFGNPLRYVDPSGHLTEDELRALLGDDCDRLMKLWEQDPYWLDVLAHLQVGGFMEATLLEGMELHIEMVDGQLEAAMYMDGKRYETDLRDWQGKGAYLIRNPGETEEQALRNRDELFAKHAQGGQIISPAYDYCPGGDCNRTPEYVGAVRTVQAVDPTYATIQGVGVFNLPIVDYVVGRALDILAKHTGVTWGISAGTAAAAVYVVDAVIFSTVATYQQPRTYSCGWPLPTAFTHPEINSWYPWR